MFRKKQSDGVIWRGPKEDSPAQKAGKKAGLLMNILTALVIFTVEIPLIPAIILLPYFFYRIITLNPPTKNVETVAITFVGHLVNYEYGKAKQYVANQYLLKKLDDLEQYFEGYAGFKPTDYHGARLEFSRSVSRPKINQIKKNMYSAELDVTIKKKYKDRRDFGWYSSIPETWEITYTTTFYLTIRKFGRHFKVIDASETEHEFLF